MLSLRKREHMVSQSREGLQTKWRAMGVHTMPQGSDLIQGAIQSLENLAGPETARVRSPVRTTIAAFPTPGKSGRSRTRCEELISA
jgi:hypothetical protein